MLEQRRAWAQDQSFPLLQSKSPAAPDAPEKGAEFELKPLKVHPLNYGRECFQQGSDMVVLCFTKISLAASMWRRIWEDLK